MAFGVFIDFLPYCVCAVLLSLSSSVFRASGASGAGTIQAVVLGVSLSWVANILSALLLRGFSAFHVVSVSGVFGGRLLP